MPALLGRGEALVASKAPGLLRERWSLLLKSEASGANPGTERLISFVAMPVSLCWSGFLA